MNHHITGETIGCALRVHRCLGAGFLESVYQNALSLELASRNLEFREQVPINVLYRGQKIGVFIADFVIAQEVILEIKAIQKLTNACEAQLINYLKATGFRTGLLLNFGSPSLQIKRKVNRPHDEPGLGPSAKSR